MRRSRRALLTSLAVLLATPSVLRRARGDAAFTLKLHHAFSAVSGSHERFLVPWSRKVETDSGGRIRVELFPSMQLGGAPAQLFDQARDGVADIVWATPSATSGRYPKTEAFELPFVLSHRALVNSKALEEFAAGNLQDEFRDVRPLCFSCRDHGVLHASRPVKSVEDMKGLRLHVSNRLAGEAVHALGAQGVSMPGPQVPMALAGHVIDACLDPWDTVPALRLNDQLKNHTDFAESALSTTSFILAMNKGTYDRLPADLKTVIDNNSGQVAAGMAGVMWDLEARAVASMTRERGDPVSVLAAEDLVRWRKATEPVVLAWQKQIKERKVDGAKLVARIHALVVKYSGEPEPQAPPRQPAPQISETTDPTTKDAAAPPQTTSTYSRPKADAPAVEPPAASVAPMTKPAPAAAPSKPKKLDIPL
jgi:TRAP-type transport system periplasmic protein